MSVLPGMTPDDCTQAQAKDPIIYQTVEAITNKAIGKWKLK